MTSTSVPGAGRLSSSLRIQSNHPAVHKVLSRLSRQSLITLALEWLEAGNRELTAPYLDYYVEDDTDDLYPPASSVEELRELYQELQERRGSKKEIVDRMLEGDWRDGLTLYQLAMADLQHLYDRPSSQKWTAYKVVPLAKQRAAESDDEDPAPAKMDKKSLVIPRFHPSTFLQRLQSIILPDVKAHYNFDRPRDFPFLVLRIFMLDTPYTTELAFSGLYDNRSPSDLDAARTLYVIFPDASPHVYISKSQLMVGSSPSISAAGGAGGAGGAAKPAGETRSLRTMLVEGIPKALSMPRQRFALKSTSLTTNNLAGLLQRRGAGRTNSAGGGWAIYADESKTESPLDILTLPTPPLSDAGGSGGRGALVESAGGGGNTRKRPAGARTDEVDPAEEQAAKRRRLAAQSRFGDEAKVNDGSGLERLDIMIEDPFPAIGGQAPSAVAGPPQQQQQQQDAAAAGQRKKARSSGGSRRSTLDAVFAAEAEEARGYDVENMDSTVLSMDDPSGVEGDGEGGQDGQANQVDDSAVGAGASTAAAAAAPPPPPPRPQWYPAVRLSFTGPHVFAGLRQLAEAGVVDAARMPGWMTGEEGCSVGVVRGGRIRGNKGSGV